MREKIVDFMIKSKLWLASLGWIGVIGLGVWYVAKIIICMFFGVCII